MWEMSLIVQFKLDFVLLKRNSDLDFVKPLKVDFYFPRYNGKI